MYSDWQAAAKARIAHLMADVPTGADWKARRQILRDNAAGFHGGTSWGKRVWAKHCKVYLAMYGKPQPAKETPLFAADIIFPFKKDTPDGPST
ncbi:hypothetical protein [Sphingobium sp. WCS2017Hpa-17]|uniref:hypothetical protein n=1 Tax=Sphingobium sp. WCS2017Hpa-17 TaxID=3073638 RepID=UPI0028897785|nr:hypothetical protein [Sphingobium sp. WCS2017Hpa-17]